MPQAECNRGDGRDRLVETRSGGGEAPARLDRDALDANTMSDRGLQAELFDLYFAQAPVYLDQLRDALTTGDATPWRSGCHGLKGTARTLGLIALAEAAASAGKVAPSTALLAQLEDGLAEAQDAARAFLDEA